MAQFILLLLGGYLLGSVPTAYLVVRWLRRIDIRQYGSGNVGMSNVAAVVSKWWAIPVTAFDLVKGIAPVGVAQWLGLNTSQQISIGLIAIMGHNWPVFLRFNGGRGMLTSLGVVLLLSPKLAIIILLLASFFLLWRQFSLGVSVALVLLPIFSWFLSQPLGIKEPLPMTLGYLALLVISLLRRLAVPRSPISASVATRELLINRLLFDRDIRDRKAWISQPPRETSLSQETLGQERQKR